MSGNLQEFNYAEVQETDSPVGQHVRRRCGISRAFEKRKIDKCNVQHNP